MGTKLSLYRVCTFLWLVYLSAVPALADTITTTESWSLFSGPDDPPVEAMGSIDMFDSSLGTLTQIDWVVQGGISANFIVAPSNWPIEYSFAAVIGCGIAVPAAGTLGCDPGSAPTQSDARFGSTLPIGGPVGVDETILLAFFGNYTFTDQESLDVLTGTTPMMVSLLVDTEALAQSCIPDPFLPGEICSPYAVGYIGDYTGTLSVTYTFDPVPIPAAVWLFGSGLLGLIGVARRKKS